MFRRVLITAAPLLFILFTACSGEDPEKAPKACPGGEVVCENEHPDDKAAREDLIQKLSAAKGSCAEAYGPAVLSVAPVIYSPNPPPPEMLFTQGPGAQALAATQAQQKQCVDALKMAIFNVTKMQNGKYWQRPDVQKWFYGVLAGIGGNIASRLPPEALANPGFVKDMKFVAAYLVQNHLAPQLDNPAAMAQVTQQIQLAGFGR